MLKHILSFTSFIIFGIFITYPLIFNIGSIATGTGDELVISWIQNWVIHSLLTGNIVTIFDANLYYPYHNSLAYSDTFFISSVLSLIPVLIIGEPIAAFNITLLLSIIFLGFSMYVLAYFLTKEFMPAFLAGILVIFSPAVLSNTTHVQMLAIIGVPMAILFLILFLEKQKTKFLIIGLSFFVLQTYNSFLPGYFIIFSYIVILGSYWLYSRKKTKQIVSSKNIAITVLLTLMILPIIIPYYQVSKEFNYVRDIRDSIHFALQPEDLLYSSAHSRLNGFYNNLPFNQTSQNSEFKPGYIGLIFGILVLFALYYFAKYTKKRTVHSRAFLLLGCVGFILSLGPVLHLGRQTVHDPFPIPLPYALFYYILPGFQGFRNSARWEILFILAMAVFIAIVLHTALKKRSKKFQHIIYGILLFGIIAEFNFPMHFVDIPQKKEFPPLYAWLNTTPNDSVIIHLPIYNWGMWPHTQQELWREYYCTQHFRKTVNGYTGFSPPPWQEFILNLNNNFPSQNSIKELKGKGIQYIIIHTDQYDDCIKASICTYKQLKKSGEIIASLNKDKELTLVKQFENTYVYKLK